MVEFTRIPNNFIDELKLNPYQFQLISIIVRKTDGWCKLEDGISLSQFEKLVTFKKPKIIQTLKELEEMGLIFKKKQILDNNSNSFNIYKISDMVVTENNKGSNSQLLGVVTEDYTQKKANTKENTLVDYESFSNLWNEFATKSNKAKIAKLTDSRKKKIALRLKEYKNLLEIFTYVLKKSENSQFLLNSNFYTFDWLFENDTNILKVYEGKYDNGKSQEVVI